MERNLIRCAGWLFWMLSIMLITWGNPPSETPFPNESQLFNVVRSFAFALVFFASAAAVRWIKRPISSNGACVIAAFLLILCIFPNIFPASMPFTAVVTGVLLGVAAALMFVLWQSEYSLIGSYSACIVLTLASCLAALVMVILFIPGRIASQELLSALFCLFSCVLFFYLKSKQAKLSPPEKRTLPALRDFSYHFWHQVICVAAFAFIWEFVLSMGMKLVNFSQMLQFSVWTQVLASLVLAVIWVARKGQFGIERLFALSFPIAATGFLLMPFLGSTFQVLIMCLVMLLFTIASILMQVTCIREFEQTGVDPVYIFGVFAGVVYTAMTSGMLAGFALQAVDEFSITHLLVIALILVYALSVVFFLLHFRKKGSAQRSSSDAGFIGAENGTKSVGAAEETINLESACEELAESCCLSVRERDVFLLLAHGRNLPYISEALFISKNTVRTHLKNIYQKMDVHNRQELLDLIEAKISD